MNDAPLPSDVAGSARTTVVVVPAFADRATSSWRRLLDTELATRHRVILLDLPGIGPAPSSDVELASMAAYVVDRLDREGHPIVLVGHSLGSVIAVAAAEKRPVAGLISIEGNLTTDDGYLSATAAAHEEPSDFVLALIARVEQLVERGQAPITYLNSIHCADPRTLWDLGRDSARRGVDDAFGIAFVSLRSATRYLWSKPSTPLGTQRFLRSHAVDQRMHPTGATHWPLEVDANWITAELETFIGDATSSHPRT